jgi:hypothetical protein
VNENISLKLRLIPSVSIGVRAATDQKDRIGESGHT